VQEALDVGQGSWYRVESQETDLAGWVYYPGVRPGGFDLFPEYDA